MFRSIAGFLLPSRFPPSPLEDEVRIMKAVVLDMHGPPEVLKLKDVVSAPKPIPNSRQVVVEVAGAGVNPVDFKMRKGPIADFLYPKPKIPGCCMAGKVARAPDDSSFKIGDPVYTMLPLLGSKFGSYASLSCVDESILAKAPTNHDLVSIATLPLVACTVVQAFRPIKAAYGESIVGKKCFITAGSGGVGTFAIQYCAHVLGMEVATSCSPKNIPLVKSLGASKVIDYTSQKLEDHIERYDVFFDTHGYQNEDLIFHPQQKEKEKAILNPENAHYIRIASSPYGSSSSSTSSSSSMTSDPFGFSIFEARLDRIALGYGKQWMSHIFSQGIKYHFVLVTPDKVALEETARAVEAGKIRPVVQEKILLAEASRAHEIIEQGHVVGKIVLVINDEL